MIGQSVGKSFAYIVGVYLGDGCVTTQTSKGRYTYTVFRLNTIDADFAASTKSALEELGSRWATVSVHAVSKSSKPNHSLAARHDDLCARLVELTDGKKKLPDDVFLWSGDEQIAFIAGLMDSEGFVAANKNPTNRRYYMGFKSCDLWVPDFIRLLESVGVMVGKVSTEAPRKPGYKVPMRFTIKMQSWIDAGCYFNVQRKQTRVWEWASCGAYERRALHPRRLTSETTRQTA